jgi:hypothetical protein
VLIFHIFGLGVEVCMLTVQLCNSDAVSQCCGVLVVPGGPGCGDDQVLQLPHIGQGAAAVCGGITTGVTSHTDGVF